MRHFSSYGPIDYKANFCVPRQALITAGVQQLIGSPEEESGHYFTIWAPRQTGKTWLIRQIEQVILQQYSEEFTVFDFSLGGLRGINVTEEQAADFPQAFGSLIKRSLPGQPELKNWADFCLFAKLCLAKFARHSAINIRNGITPIF